MSDQPVKRSVLADRPNHNGLTFLPPGVLGLYIRGNGLSLALDEVELRRLATFAQAYADARQARDERVEAAVDAALARIVAQGAADA